MERDRREKVTFNFKTEDLLIGKFTLDQDFCVTEIEDDSARLIGGESSDILSLKFGEDFGPKREDIDLALKGNGRTVKFKGIDGNTFFACFRIKENSNGYNVVFLKEEGCYKCGDGSTIRTLEDKLQKEHFSNYSEFLENVLLSVCHDLKTHLGVVLGYSELLLKSKSTSQNILNTERALKSIYKNCAYLANAVEKLENFESIVKRGKGEEKSLFSLLEELKNTIKRVSRTAFSKQVRIELQEAEDLKIYASPTIVSAILDEILKTSLAYCQKGKSVTINLKKLSKKVVLKIDISSLEEGIPPLTQIVDKFFHIPLDYKSDDFLEGIETLGFFAIKQLAYSENFDFQIKRNEDFSYTLFLEIQEENRVL